MTPQRSRFVCGHNIVELLTQETRVTVHQRGDSRRKAPAALRAVAGLRAWQFRRRLSWPGERKTNAKLPTVTYILDLVRSCNAHGAAVGTSAGWLLLRPSKWPSRSEDRWPRQSQ